MNKFIVLAAATLVSGSAFAADTAARDAAASERGRNAATADRSENPDQMFVKDAISGNMLEVQLGQIAQDKATDEQVKQFGAMMVKDHTQALQKLRQLAKSSSLDAEDRLNPACQAKLQEMQKLPADAFTRKYAIGQYAHHVMDVLEYTWESQNAENAELKEFATKALPTLREHQEHAQQLAMAVAGASSTDAARTAGTRVHKTGGGNSTDKTATGDAAQRSDGANRASDRDNKDADATKDAGSPGRAQ